MSRIISPLACRLAAIVIGTYASFALFAFVRIRPIQVVQESSQQAFLPAAESASASSQAPESRVSNAFSIESRPTERTPGNELLKDLWRARNENTLASEK